jgi:pilus assembly protein CpaD
MFTTRSASSLRRRIAAAAMMSAAVVLAGCKHDPAVTGSIPAARPDDYRLRHPIAITEADRSIEVFVGNSRGGLSNTQRADIAALGGTWMRDGTGAIIADVPTHTPNARAAAETAREIRAMLIAMGVPARGIIQRSYRPDNPRLFATIRLSYPKITATAGPCGVWPDDLGPSVKNRDYFENRPYANFGCANQRNLAAMVDNPSDLVQPRPETPAYSGRRMTVLEKYRKGESTATVYPDANKSNISSVGQ